MARDAEFDLIANDKTSKGVGSARRNLEGLDKDTKKFASNISKASSEMIGNGTKIGALFGTNIAKGLSRAAPAIAPVLAGVAIAAAPVIGGTIAASIIGGAGIGGVIGGVILASRDARVKAAGANLGKNILGSLEKDASVFVQPVLSGINQIQSAFNRVRGNISSIFANSAGFVRPLVAGVTGALTRITQGVDKLVANAGPVIEIISSGVARLGDAVGDVFESLADNGVSAAVALNQVFNLVEASIRAVGSVINGLTEAFGFLAKLGLFGREAQLEMFRLEANAKLAKQGADQLTGGLLKTAEASRVAAAETRSLNDQIRDVVSNNNSLFSSQTSAAEAIANTSKAIRENGRTLDTNTEKGRANRQALSNLANALNSQYDATVKVNGAGRAADGVAASNRASFIRLATQLTGSASKARDLANQLLGVPRTTNTTAKMNKASASAAASAYRKQLDGIPRSITTVLTIARRVTGSTASDSALKSALNKQNFSASQYFAEAGPGANRGVRAEPVSVTSDVNVYLDGTLLDARTDTKIRRNGEYQAHKLAVGRVY